VTTDTSVRYDSEVALVLLQFLEEDD